MADSFTYNSRIFRSPHNAINETYRTFTALRYDLTNKSVNRCGCSSGIKSEAVRDSISALGPPYTQETYLTERKNIFRYIILGIIYHLLQLQSLTLLHTGATKEGPPGPPGLGLTLHCATVRIHFAVVNVYRRG